MTRICILILLFVSYGVYAEAAPDNGLTGLKETIELFKNGKDAEAKAKLLLLERDIESLLDKTPDPETWLLLGRAYFYGGMDAKATESLRSALKYDPKSAEAHFFLGLINIYASDFEAAQREISDAIDIDNTKSKYYLELGRVLEMQKVPEKALAAYQKAVELEPGNFNASFNAGNSYAEQGRFEEANRLYLNALKSRPGHIDTLYNLGQINQNQGNHKNALKYFSRVFELDPSGWRALSKMVQEYQALGMVKEREQSREKIYHLWQAGQSKELAERGFYIREQFSHEEGKIFVLEYFQLKGDRARKYVFQLYDPETNNHKFDISLGSYESTTKISRELGDIGPDERLYHLDGYAPDGSHYTYAFFDSEPDYDDVRGQVIKVLAGDLKAASATIPNSGGEQD